MKGSFVTKRNETVKPFKVEMWSKEKPGAVITWIARHFIDGDFGIG